MSVKTQVTFKIAPHELETIDAFIKQSGVTRSKFMELVVRSAAESIRSISSIEQRMDFDEEVGQEIPVTVRGEADMRQAREFIEALFKINQAMGDDDEA